jgi:glycerate kinase
VSTQSTHVLVAPDKFKGSLTAAQVADAVARGIRSEHPDWTITELPVADGGDGTVAAALAAGWSEVTVDTTGPTGRPLRASYATRDATAVVELASSVGLDKLPDGAFDPLGATTFGLGTVIKAALDDGAREIVVGLGGSASTDGGAGMLQALGVEILNPVGRPLPAGGAALVDAARLDLTGLHPAAREARFLVACDVDNPLLGSTGATAVYAPQKGASGEDLVVLEAAMQRWAEVVAAAVGHDHAPTPGAGAAGGTAFGLLSVLGAQPRPGIDLVLELVDFEAHLRGVDLVITGEGSLDEQSLHGKAPVGVASVARRSGVPVSAVAGRNLLSGTVLRQHGIQAAYALTEIEPDVAACMANAAALLGRLAQRIADDLEYTRFGDLASRGEAEKWAGRGD